MTDENDISPTRFDVMSKGDNSVCAGVNGIAKIGVAAAASVPVFSKMRRRAQAQASGFVIVFCIGLADRVVKAIGDIYLGRGVRGGWGENDKKQNEEKTERRGSPNPAMQNLNNSEEFSHLRLIEPVEGRSGKRKEKRRTFVGCAVLRIKWIN